MNKNNQFLEIVNNDQLRFLQPEYLSGTTVRLTGIQTHATVSLEIAELDPGKYEGKALMVPGRGGGGWVYSAEVIDHVGQFLRLWCRSCSASERRSLKDAFRSYIFDFSDPVQAAGTLKS